MSDEKPKSNVVEFIPRDVYETEFSPAGELNRIANSGEGPVSLPRELNRRRVVSAFMDAFETMGGVPRLVAWANEHPGDFYKLYARLLPSQSTAFLGEGDVKKIIHVIPRSELDE